VAGAPTEPLTGGPAEVPVVAGGASDEPGDLTAHRDSRADVVKAYAPYAIIVLVFSIAQVGVVKQALESMTYVFDWPGLHVVSEAGEPIPYVYTLNWASAPGTLLFLSGLITLAVLRLSLLTGLRTYAETIRQFGWAIFTILCVFALAYLMNVSGQTATLGLWLAGTGAFFAFLSPVVGWFGVTITGTDAGSNALFGKLQVTAAQQIGLPPELLAAANSTGGVLGKMISTQSLAVATAAVGIVGQEGVLFRRIFGWSLGLLLVLCVLVYLQSTPVLGWMVGS
jgi:lactate permease